MISGTQHVLRRAQKQLGRPLSEQESDALLVAVLRCPNHSRRTNIRFLKSALRASGANIH